MSKILVGLAVHKPDRRFLESLPSFFQDSGRRNEMESLWIWDKTLVDAQNVMADELLKGDYDYLLTIEDDHWGFTWEMLKTLLNMDTDIAAISYRNRHFPFGKIPMTHSGFSKDGFHRFLSINEESGWHEADLCGFGFTLIKRHVIETLDKPVFRLNRDRLNGCGPHATDVDFCLRAKAKGFKILGCFDHLLNHRDISDETYKEMLVSGTLAKHSMFTHIQRMHRQMINGNKGGS